MAKKNQTKPAKQTNEVVDEVIFCGRKSRLFRLVLLASVLRTCFAALSIRCAVDLILYYVFVASDGACLAAAGKPLAT